MTRYYYYKMGDKRCIIKHNEGKGGVVIHIDKYRINLVTDATIKVNYIDPKNFKPRKVLWTESGTAILARNTTEKLFNYWHNYIRQHVDGQLRIDNFLFSSKELSLDLLKNELHSLISRYVPSTKTPGAHSRLDETFKYIQSFGYELNKQ